MEHQEELVFFGEKKIRPFSHTVTDGFLKLGGLSNVTYCTETLGCCCSKKQVKHLLHQCKPLHAHQYAS